MKQKTHRLLSLLLCMVMVLGLLPATPAMASEPGETEDNPVVCTNFNSFKTAMENPTIQYVELRAVNESIPVAPKADNTCAIDVKGSKTLTVTGNVYFNQHGSDEKYYWGLMSVGEGVSLTVKGDKELQYGPLATNAYNSVICNYGGTVTVSGNVGLFGGSNTAPTYGRAITQVSGSLFITGGVLTGRDSTSSPTHPECAVVITGGEFSISGGTFKNITNTGMPSRGIMIQETATGSISAGTFENGIRITKENVINPSESKTVSDYIDKKASVTLTSSGAAVATNVADISDNITVVPPAKISTIDYNLSAPSAETASPQARTSTEGVKILSTTWYEGPLSEHGTKKATSFVAGNTYYSIVVFQPEEGYQFCSSGDSMTVKCNGKDASESHATTYVNAMYEFKATDKPYTGTGSYNDPAVCTTFAGFKAAMEKSSVQYVKLVGGSYYYDTDTIPETEDGKIRNAVFCEGTKKVLILEGKTEFTGPATCNGLINVSVGNQLTITGDGYLAFSTAGHHEEDAVVNVNGTGAYLIVEGNAHLYGHSKTTGTHGRAIYAKTGTVIINGGYLTGQDDLGKYADLIFTGAVAITDDANFYFYGGNISTDRATETGKTCESALYL